ncbi:unannotated protein [freshwater metagenome]|uniref:Unannotated protein n=1 Tax=freshwater metagenome TaxID=449393 RepID=A0A6J6EE71_9ZZZZ
MIRTGVRMGLWMGLGGPASAQDPHRVTRSQA